MSKLIFTLSDISFSMTKNWFIDIFRALFAFLDFIVYFVIELLFRAVFNLSNFELYGMYEEIMDRVYVILGIFMLFKVTISLITYLVNPDKINDKEQGVGKLTTRVITVLIMLIGLPTFFSLMTEAQNKLLPVVPRVIIGTANTLSSEDVSGISSNMALTMIQGFAHVKDGCSNTPVENLSGFLAHINDSCESSEGSTQGNSKAYAYDYLPIISTITGAIMIYVVFSLCISVSIRAFKLIILRSIAPIPVLSYIDPKSSKDGPFAAWRKTFFSTWAELFINLGIIYFVVYIIDYMLSGDAYLGFFDNVGIIDGIFLLAFIIVGLLMFAKQAPKFVMDALGIKSKGNFTRMLGLGAAAVGMGGTIASGIRNRNNYSNEHGGLTLGKQFRNIGASLFNGAMSGVNAGSDILSADKPTLRTGFDSQQKYRSNMISNITSGIGVTDRGKAVVTGMLFGTTPLDDMDRQISDAKAKASTAKQLKEYAIGEGKKKTAHIQTDYDINGHVQHISLDEWNQAVAFANSPNGDGYIHFSDGTMVAATSSLANKIQGDLEERAGKLYAEGVENGNYDDPGALDAFRKTLADSLGVTVEDLKSYEFNGTTIDLYHNPTDVKKIEKSSQTEAFKIENSSEYSNAKKIYKKNNNN